MGVVRFLAYAATLALYKALKHNYQVTTTKSNLFNYGNDYGRDIWSYTVDFGLYGFFLVFFYCVFLVFSVYFDLFIFSSVTSKFRRKRYCLIFILHSLVNE